MSIEWKQVRRVLVVRLRSIGDTVLSTPSLIALKRFLPDAEIDILLEDWVAPLLEGFDAVDNILTVGQRWPSRLRAVRQIRRRKYDVVFNLHGGTTSTFFTIASRAADRVGYSHYRFAFLHNHVLSSSSDYWRQEHTHSAEQQLALLGSVGVPVDDRPRSRLIITGSARASMEAKLADSAIGDRQSAFVLIHPTAAFTTKQWAVENFARTAEFLASMGLTTVAIAAPNEREVLEQLRHESHVPVVTFDNLSLPEITALASKAKLFVGNDSGIAHIAAAVSTPTVVIFGSSNIHHWRPWTDAPNEIVRYELPCQPCAGYECKEFGDPKCILNVSVKKVTDAIERVLAVGKRRDIGPAVHSLPPVA